MDMRSFVCPREGSVLILVTLILLVLSVLGMALLGITMTNYMINKAEREYQIAFYYAEMGTRKGMEQIKIEFENFYSHLEAELRLKRPDDPPGPYETKFKSARFFSTIRDSAAVNFKKPSIKSVTRQYN
jgi:Tfp pilus assembly protein PilX